MKILVRIFHHFHILINNPRTSLIQFSIGTAIFFAGMSAVMIAEHYMQPSINQEILTLCGMAIALAGFIVGFSAYLTFIISRFKNL